MKEKKPLIIKKVPINSIKPYKNNARKIGRSSIDAIKESIKKFGYNSPILVDKNNVIIAGHARRLALLELDFVNIHVISLTLPNKKVKELRLLDNRISSFSRWNDRLLLSEVRKIISTGASIEAMGAAFGSYLDKVALPVSFNKEAKESDFEKAKEMFNVGGNVGGNVDKKIKTIVCPACKKEFKIRI